MHLTFENVGSCSVYPFSRVVTSSVLDCTEVLACSGVKGLKKEEKQTPTCISVFGKRRSADGPRGGEPAPRAEQEAPRACAPAERPGPRSWQPGAARKRRTREESGGAHVLLSSLESLLNVAPLAMLTGSDSLPVPQRCFISFLTRSCICKIVKYFFSHSWFS